MLKSLTLWYIISVRGTAQHSKALFEKKKNHIILGKKKKLSKTYQRLGLN